MRDVPINSHIREYDCLPDTRPKTGIAHRMRAGVRGCSRAKLPNTEIRILSNLQLRTQN
ncbi:hypothetical protein GJV44_p00032 (plasmid) [Candidatus Vallotia cooleyia]|nr:hypothetical protein GJV44_p00032 [Candidatus Vallotia cooleyia]